MKLRTSNDLFAQLPGPRGLSRAHSTWLFFETPLKALPSLHAERGDLAAINIFGQRLVSIRNPEWIDRMLRDPDGVFIKDRVLRDLKTLLGEGLLTAENPLWMQQRRRIAPAFTRKHILAYAQTMRRITREALDGWEDGQRLDLHATWLKVTLRIAVQTLFDANIGTAEADVSRALDQALMHFDKELNTPLGLMPAWIPTRSRRTFAEAVATLDRVVLGLIAERESRGDVGVDLLGRMMFATDESGARMSQKQLRDEVLTLFLAGHETTALTMTWTLMLLSQHPVVADRLREEIAAAYPDPDDDGPIGVEIATRLPYTMAVLRESMRLYPPAWVVGREATAPVRFGDHEVPAGSQVLACTWLMHRDGRFFERPLRFEPERWLDGLHERLPKGVYFPFGGGPRVCIGNHFAMMEAAILLTETVRRFTFTVDPSYTVELVPSITLRPRYGMPGVVRRVAAR